MDDLGFGLKYPATIDFKIGSRTFDPEATPEKIAKETSKYLHLEKTGFQLLAMRVSLQLKIQFNFEECFFVSWSSISHSIK